MKVQLINWLYAVILFCAFPTLSLADSRCNETLKQTESKVGALSAQDVSAFFQSFNNECLKSAEFSEWSNELLFSVIEKQPQEFINMLEKQDEKRVKAILSDLESPIHDGIDIKIVYASVKSTKNTSKTKNRIIKALQIAGNNSGLVLK